MKKRKQKGKVSQSVSRILIALAMCMVFPVLSATQAAAQTNNIPFQHVIIVMQENRTPDQLFGSDAFNSEPKLPGADLTQTGPCEWVPAYVTLQSTTLGTYCDPKHDHQASWRNTYHKGLMDGACSVQLGSGSGNCKMADPQYTYVQEPDVDPYFTIAQTYGYGNYMFQTNQGPSFEAHQFLFSGTSAPDQIGDDYDESCQQYCNGGSCPLCHFWFAAELEQYPNNTYGCPGTTKTLMQIEPLDNNEYAGYKGKKYQAGYPCYNHPSLPTLLDAQKITWGYYTHHDRSGFPAATSLWTAPNAISAICGTLDQNNNCTGQDWTNYVSKYFPNTSPNYTNSYSPILTDLGADPYDPPQCALPAVSWVVPDGAWSDHGGAGQATTAGGPSWVAAIVNAVGGWYLDGTNTWKQTACHNPDGSPMYWGNTAIIVTWDDWGGWYDHVLPWHCNVTGQCSGYGDNESGDYTYGFRVPLLVVSAYTGTWNGTTWTGGYLSGACTPSTTPCPNYGQADQYVHDFGSILNFVEYVFGIAQPGGIYPSYPYADFYAQDGPNSLCGPVACPFGLSDFFHFGAKARPFTLNNVIGQPIPTTCFLNPYQSLCPWTQPFTPSDPDQDAVDSD